MPVAGRVWAAVALAGLLPAARAQGELQAVGVFSLLGDAIQIVVADRPTDTRVDRNARETMVVPDIGFDVVALNAARHAIRKTHARADVSLLRATAPLSLGEQRTIVDGAGRGELPEWIVQIIAAKKLSHVILISRSRGPAEARAATARIGRGTVQGIGFYIDTNYLMRNTRTKAISNGLIAPYTHLRLT